jgi:hypothetical protein
MRRRLLVWSSLVAAAAASAACKPDLGPTSSLVTRERVLAVRAEPAEVAPGRPVSLAALAVGPDGTLADAPLGWSFCTAPKPLNENNTVANACLQSLDALAPLDAVGTTIAARIPDDACQRFGPDPPPQKQGEPPLRPRDPDVTGGYYQPARVDGAGEPTFGLVRITCNLKAVTTEIAAEFATRYTANLNPVLGALTARVGDEELALDALPAEREVTLRVDWSPESVETFPVYDLLTQALVEQREAMRVSWFATGGTLALDRSGRAGDEPETFAENVWRTPPPGPAHLWLVLRDSRGGVAWAAYDVTIR